MFVLSLYVREKDAFWLSLKKMFFIRSYNCQWDFIGNLTHFCYSSVISRKHKLQCILANFKVQQNSYLSGIAVHSTLNECHVNSTFYVKNIYIQNDQIFRQIFDGRSA